MVYENKIMNNIYLGNYNDSMNNDFINDFNLIINCSKDLPFNNNINNNIKKIRISINDDLSKQSNIDLYNYLNYITNVMHQYTNNNKKIFVYCYAGKQRSPSIIAAYLIKYYNFSTYEAINFIKQKKNNTFKPKVNFYNSLNNFNK
tara:strand:- start:3 stop:440 length:438 start_codon:yes stop_codon:yes gene_type:complete